jgi:hypothetical protein
MYRPDPPGLGVGRRANDLALEKIIDEMKTGCKVTESYREGSFFRDDDDDDDDDTVAILVASLK